MIEPAVPFKANPVRVPPMQGELAIALPQVYSTGGALSIADVDVDGL